MRRGRLICGMITSLIFFAIGLVQPADALVVRDMRPASGSVSFSIIGMAIFTLRWSV
jgi:hypothetical protein